MRTVTQGLWWLLPTLLLVTGYWLTAEQPRTVEVPEPTMYSSAMRMIANQGQWPEAARYKIRLNGGNVWLTEGGLVYQLHEALPTDHHGQPAVKPAPTPDSLRHHVFRVQFADSRPEVRLQPSMRYPEYHNYFIGNDPSRWAGRVPLFGLVTYESLYPGVDMRLYGQDDYLKYDFMIEPGADPSQIRLTFEGITPRLNKHGELHYDLGFREIIEQAPLAYQPVGTEKQIVPCEYRLTAEGLRYVFPEGYDPAYPLVIDPTLEFSTYTGSFSDNWGFTATYDTAGNAYGGGIQHLSTVAPGFPTTTGAFQTVFQDGITDATISKFSEDGSALLYSTFLGGSDNDQPHSMIVNSRQELIVMGRTESGDFPIPSSGFQSSPQGGWDMFVVRFSEDGSSLLGGTYLGGGGDDGVNIEAWTDNVSFYSTTKYNYGDDSRGEVIVDAADAIYVTAPTKSSNFPITTGAAQTLYGGDQDGVVVKLSPDLSVREWATYFGGSNEDATHTIKLDENGNVFIAGGTASSNLATTGGVIQPSYGGGITDGFVASLSPDGQSILACTYLGTGQYDQVFLLEFDSDNSVYVTGQTLGDWPVVDPPAGLVYRVGGGKLFINKLSNDLRNTEFSTRLGAPGNTNYPNISPTAFLVDRCDNMYLAGWGVAQLGGSPNRGTTDDLPTPGGPIDNTTDGADMYLMVLSRNAQTLTYATFLGGIASEHLDGGTCRFDKKGILYHAVCAGCGGNSSFPSTAGVYSLTNNSSNCNLAVFKMAFELDGVEADFLPLDEDNQPLNALSGCAPLTVNFDNRSFRGANPGTVDYFWDFGYNGATSTQVEPSFAYPEPGTYTAMLVITDSSSCNISDTTYQDILVYPEPAVDAGPDQSACPDDTITLQTLSNAVNYQWSPSTFILGNPNQATVQVRVQTTTRFILTITNDNGCEARDTVIVSTDNALEVDAGDDREICQGGGATLTATAQVPLVSYQWRAIPSVPIANPDQANITVGNLDTTTLFVVEVEDAVGCRGRDTVRVAVYEVFTLSDTFVCEGSSLVLATSNGVSFSWAPDDGSLSSPTVASPTATPTQTTTYTVIATSAAGCVSEKEVLVEVFPRPTAEAGPDTELCLGEDTQLRGSGGLIYRWRPGGSLSDSLIADPFATPTQTTDYILTVADMRGCEDQDTVNVVVNPLPEVRASDDATICEFDSIPLQVTGAQRYEWVPVQTLSDPSSAAPVAFPRDTTSYVVSGTDERGCVNRDTVLISVIPKPVTVVDGENFCDLRFVELRATGGETYQWNTGQTDSVLQIAPPSEPQTYIATAFVGGCEGYPDTITIDENFGYPEAAFEVQQAHDFAPQTIDFLNLTTGAVDYFWTFGFTPTPSYEENPSYGYPNAGEYQVRLIAFSRGRCPDTAFQTIRLENVTLFIPSAFTPDGNGTNDRFLIQQQGLSAMQFTIYSRWGQKVYETDNLDFRWDGTYQGEGRPVQEGVYVYVLRATGINGNRFTRQGTITLVR